MYNCKKKFTLSNCNKGSQSEIKVNYNEMRIESHPF